MKGIWFGNIHSFDDLNLVLSKVEIPPATAKTIFVDIPGGDGSADLTEALGEVRFEDRECEFTFTVFPTDDFEKKKRQISNLLNGKRFKIKVDKDPGYYWDGRCTINEYASDKNIHQIVVGANVAPYKLKNSKTSVFVPFCGKNLLDVSEANQLAQLHGSVEYIPNGVRKSGTYFVGYPVAVNPNTTYFFSVNVKCITIASTASAGGRIAVFDRSLQNRIASFPSTEGDAVFSFNSGEHTEVMMLFYSDSAENQGVYEFTNAQVEVVQATEYEPYSPTKDPQEVILTNARKTVVPTIICTGEAAVTIGDATYKFGEGTFKNLNIQLKEGETPVSVSGTGAVHFVYQEGDL